MNFYRVAAMNLGSEIVLPGLIAAGPGPVAPDVFARIGEVPECLEDGQHAGPNWQFTTHNFLLSVPGVARFLITEGREITIAPENGTPPEEIAIFLGGTVMGILLQQRGRIVLHASAVLVGGRAVLFCGASGAGKSTLGAALNRRGYPVVADDICTLGFDRPGGPDVLPDGRNLKLWAEAIETLGFERGAPVRSALEKYYVEPVSVLSEAVPFGALYALRAARPPLVPGIERPNIVDAALLLGHNAYRPTLVQRMNQKASYFAAATRVANAGGIFQLTRELDLAKMDTVLDWLEAHWAETGLTAAAA